MDPLTFWSGIAVVALPGIIALIRDLRMARLSNDASAPLTNAQAQNALGDAMEKLGQEYARMITVNAALENEAQELRPLTLKIALCEQNMIQVSKDKEDWKRYAVKLADQLEANNIIPIPFRRLPTDEDSQKIQAITDKMIDAYAKTGIEPDLSAKTNIKTGSNKP